MPIFVRVVLAALAAFVVPAPALAQSQCGSGYEKSGAFCYPPCRDNYNGVGPVCWQRCPDGYKNDGATCRKDAKIVAKPSYGRGVGKPLSCAGDEESDAGLCYKECKSGYNGVGPVCWQRCPDGYKNDGATCRRNAKIIKANNSKCPWYDKCGLAAKKGCSKCPEGYKNDGCTCRRNVHIFAKDSYGRGVGKPVHACKAGQEKDAGLCYAQCKSGYKGVGPVCWGKCAQGFKDDGATCRKDVHIVAKKSYGRGVGKFLRRDYHGLFFRYIRDHHNMYYFRGKGLSEAEKTYLKQWFPARLVDKVRVVEELLSTGAFSHKADATTFGNNLIVINRKRAGNRPLNLFKHEFVHICQYDRLGTRGFAERYADEYVDNGYDYDNMPMENEAFDYQRLDDATTPAISDYHPGGPARGRRRNALLYARCK